jgi:hypothetical protein
MTDTTKSTRRAMLATGQPAADLANTTPHYLDKHDLVFRDDAGRAMSRQRMT